MSGRTLCWFSCGAASAVATRLTLSDNPEALVVYCETGAEHPDNERFLADCVRWFNAPVERIRSASFVDTWAVWEKRRFLSGFNGAPCTSELKVAPRLDFQLPSDKHIWGYTADKLDMARFERMLTEYPNMKQRAPLIERGLTKEHVLAMVQGAGIKLPAMYGLGFQNNNCIPCVKATSPKYWAAIRKHFPEHFERMAKLSRELGARLARINDERIFIDEIPEDWPTLNPISPSCDFLCHIAEQDMGEAA